LLWFLQLSFLFSFIPYSLCSQGYPFREYGVVDGLPQSQIYEIIQDSRGFLWIRTKNGLSRYDGVEFVNYFRRDGLPSNYVNRVTEDSKGTVWAVTPEGVSEYTGSGFRYYQPPEPYRSLLYVKALAYKDKLLLFATFSSEGLGRILTFNDSSYAEFSRNYPPLDKLRIIDIECNNEKDELVILDKDGFVHLWKDEQLSRLPARNIYGLILNNNDIIAYSNEGNFVYDGTTFSKTKSYLDNGKVDAMFTGPVYGKKLDYYNGETLIHLDLTVNTSRYFFDNENNLWLESENNMFRLLSSSFYGFSYQDIGEQNLWAIAADRNGHLWFGSLYGSLTEYDGEKFIQRKEHKSLFQSGLAFYKGSRLMSDGVLWFSTNYGVLTWDGVKFSRLKSIPSTSQVCYIYEDPDDKSVLVGTDKGLYLIKNDSVSFFSKFNDNDLGVIEGATKLDNGKYLLSGHHGLIEFGGINPIQLREEVLPDVFTYTIEKDVSGGIWVTSDEGLYFRAKSSERFVHGLPESINKAANSISIIDKSHLIVGRGTDICIIDLDKFYRGEKMYFRIYDKSDGFEGSDCIDNGIIKDRSGRFWILTANKVVRVDPSSLKVNKIPPKVHITGLYFQNDSLEWLPVEKNNLFYGIPDVIRINHLQNKIQITFTGISTTNPEKVLMQYRLVGIDNKWSIPTSKRSVVYEKLPHGSYQFEIKAVNADGFETTEPLVLALKVLPTIWQTLLFKILYVIVSICLTIAFTAMYLSRRQRKKAEEAGLRSELASLQMNSVLGQFDPHFTFNVISSVGSLIMKGEKEVAYDFMSKLSGLLRTVLSDGSIIVRPLADELDFVKRYCELQRLRFKERFNYQINIDSNVDLQREIPKMTIQTFVENAIKHGFDNRKSGGKVLVSVSNIDNNLEILIADDGIGRTEASRNSVKGSGNGIRLVSGLLEIMNSKNHEKAILEVRDLYENEMPSGTEVRIFIPGGYSFTLDRKTR
jgi:ligand-binding sensor domain-containing protein